MTFFHSRSFLQARRSVQMSVSTSRLSCCKKHNTHLLCGELNLGYLDGWFFTFQVWRWWHYIARQVPYRCIGCLFLTRFAFLLRWLMGSFIQLWTVRSFKSALTWLWYCHKQVSQGWHRDVALLKQNLKTKKSNAPNLSQQKSSEHLLSFGIWTTQKQHLKNTKPQDVLLIEGILHQLI